jgi:hypothetical protein
MRAASLALIASLGACGSSQTATVIESAPGSAAQATSSTPPPEVTLDDHGFRTPGLPAISADGKLVVLGETESDPRGYPNLRVVSRDRNDAIVESITVLRPSELEQAMGPGWRNPKLDARISAANNWLAKLHGARTLITLPQLGVDSTDGYTQHAASSGPTFLDWQKDVVTIKQSGKVIATHPSPLTWHATETGACTNPSKLGGAWVDVERKLALVQIAYNGTDTCWEPSAQHHVISW